MINVFEPSIGEAELAAIAEVVASGWTGRGPRVRRFEAAFAAVIARPTEEVTSVSCGTEGLFHALAAIGVGPCDDVVLPTVSFVGAAHAVRATGARVVLCDVDSCTLNPLCSHVESALTPATAAVVLLHFGGEPGAVPQIAALLREREILLVEDAAVGLGSYAGATPCGTVGDIGVWSFDSMKLVTAGDGGIVWCRDPSHVEAVSLTTTLGGAPSGFAQRDAPRWWELEPRVPGRRSIMNDINAAIGLVQIDRLGEFIARRAQIAAAYEAGLRDLSWLSVQRRGSDGAARTFCWIHVKNGLRDSLASQLLHDGIYTTFKYWPVHRMSLYREASERFPGAEQAAASVLLLPMHQGLTGGDVEHVIAAIRRFGSRRAQ